MSNANSPSRPKRPRFSTARRGFEKTQVEAYLDEMSRFQDKLASSAALAECRLVDTIARLEETTARVTELESQVGARAGVEEPGEPGHEAAAPAYPENVVLAKVQNAESPV